MNISSAQQLDNTPTLDIDPFSIAFLSNPYPYYEQLRKLGSVVFLPKYNSYAIVGFDQVQEAVSNWQVFTSECGIGLKNFKYEEPELFPKNLILEVDAPAHVDIRKVLSSVISRSSFQDMREQFQMVADDIIKTLVTQEKFNGVSDIAEAFHLKAFGDVLGLEPEDRENLILLTNAAFNEFGAENEIVDESRSELMGPVSWALGQSLRDALTPGSLGARLYEKVDEGLLDEDDAASLFRSVMTGSYNTIHSIGDMLACFAQFPAQWQALKAADNNYAVRSQVFDEVLRYCSPLQTYFRTTTQEVELGGVIIPAESKVQLFIAAANRDPQRWHKPNEFDINREQHKHVALGKGPHACVGEQIARMEADAILEALLKYIPDISLLDKPRYHLNNIMRGLASLPMTFTEAYKDAGCDNATIEFPSSKRNNSAEPVPITEITLAGAPDKHRHEYLDSLSQQSLSHVTDALIELIEQRKTDHFEQYWHDDYKQHNPLIPNGCKAVKRFFTLLRPKSLKFEFGLSIADANIVALHSTVESFLGKPKQVVIDFFKVTDGKIVEHWDLLQDWVPSSDTANGKPMFTVTECGSSPSTVADNKQRVTTALTKLLLDRDESSLSDYWQPDLIQHDPAIANGSQAFARYLQRLPQGFSVDLGFVMAQGNTVIVQSRWLVEGKEPLIVGDIFRLVDGKIAEQWRVSQNEVPIAKSINGNEMYPVAF